MTKRKINLGSILDFIIVVVSTEKKKHVSLPYGIFLTRVFNKAQFPLAREGFDNKRLMTIMKTLQALGLNPQALKKKKETKKKKKAAANAMVPSTKKSKSKPSEVGKKKRKSRRERSLSPILEERRSKRGLLKLSEASSSPKADNEVSTIIADPINTADIATILSAPAAPTAKGIFIQEPALAKPSPKKVLEAKGKKKLREVSIALFEESTPFPLRRARMEAKENKLKEEAWLQKQKNKATDKHRSF